MSTTSTTTPSGAPAQIAAAAAATTPPLLTVAQFTTITALHKHYRQILQLEREAIILERRLWDQERELYQQQISELEANIVRKGGHVSGHSMSISGSRSSEPQWQFVPQEICREVISSSSSVVIPEPTATMTQSSGGNESQIHHQPGKSAETELELKNTPKKPEEEECESEEEISDIAALIQEATRIVGSSSSYNSRSRRALSFATGYGDDEEEEHEFDDDDGEHDSEGGDGRRAETPEQGIELRLKKTSNFGMEFGRAWR